MVKVKILATYIPKQKIIFIHISKAGGTSVTNWIHKNFNGFQTGPKHCRIDRIKQKNIDFNYHFTIIRNPFARVHSWFHYHKKLQTQNKLIDKKQRWKNSNKTTFADWVLTTSMKANVKNSIWWTQKSFIDIHLEHDACKLENINSDFQRIQRRLDCFKPLPVTNTSKHNHYRKDYTPETRKIIEEHFQEDFEYFGYDF